MGSLYLPGTSPAKTNVPKTDPRFHFHQFDIATGSHRETVVDQLPSLNHLIELD